MDTRQRQSANDGIRMLNSQQQVIQRLGIDIERFFQSLETGSYRHLLNGVDKDIICRFLLGSRRKSIAEAINLRDADVGNRLNLNIYPRISEVMNIDQGEIANNWTLILNFLLHPENGYKLSPPPQLNSDNFQSSFGRQVFFYPPDRAIVQDQIQATQRYQQGLYYQALCLFVKAWNAEYNLYGKGNPEVAIYINNCLLEYQKNILQKQKVQVYTLAVVVPFHHNRGRIAAEILRGVAQIQSQVNLQNFDVFALEHEFCGRPDSQERDRSPNFFSIFASRELALSSGGIAFQVMVVNDPNNVYDPYNQTAERLAKVASQLNLMAVIGHYSTEMTQTALTFYAAKGIPLINASSTSDQLFQTDETINFFRLTTHDRINAAQLVHYLSTHLINRELKKVAIVYNENSSYSRSYKTALTQSLEQYPDQFQCCSVWGAIGGQFQEVQAYLATLQEANIDVIVLIPDGGIEPNSLHNAGLISRLNLRNCVIVGSATFYQENVLHWMHERSQSYQESAEEQLIACIPWHWHSQVNGCESHNSFARRFCQLADQLWGSDQVTWRSATAFDALLLILRTLERYHCPDSESLMIRMQQDFKVQGKDLKGVTGVIQFDRETGNRMKPPAEIVAVKQDKQKPNQPWKWVHLQSM